MKKYQGTNVVTTNASAQNHGKPATLNVAVSRGSVRLTHRMASGGNEYGIDISCADTLPAVLAQLIPHCPKSALPQLMCAIGTVIAAE